MTNLEFYKDEIIEANKGTCLGGLFYTLKDEVPICGKNCRKCLEEGIDWLLQEHKEKIKLSVFERDLLKAHDIALVDKPFRREPLLMTMKLVYGYFEDVADLETSIRYIIRHCEVVER